MPFLFIAKCDTCGREIKTATVIAINSGYSYKFFYTVHASVKELLTDGTYDIDFDMEVNETYCLRCGKKRQIQLTLEGYVSGD